MASVWALGMECGRKGSADDEASLGICLLLRYLPTVPVEVFVLWIGKVDERWAVVSRLAGKAESELQRMECVDRWAYTM
jgi:hypothetical protein